MVYENMVIGGRYHWRGQPERLIYIGRRQYPGDRRFWYQFTKVDKPEIVWSEVLDSDLPNIEETKTEVDDTKDAAVDEWAVHEHRTQGTPGDDKQQAT